MSHSSPAPDPLHTINSTIMAPWIIELPPGYLDPSLLALDENGKAYLRTHEEVYGSSASYSPSSEGSSYSSPEFSSGTERRHFTARLMEDTTRQWNWDMSAIFAYDAQMREEQVARHRETINKAHETYAARIRTPEHKNGQVAGTELPWLANQAQVHAEQAIHPLEIIENACQAYGGRPKTPEYHEEPVRRTVLSWPAAEGPLTAVIELLEFEIRLTREGCQRWEVLDAWLRWATASKARRHTVQLEQIMNIHRFLKNTIKDADRADYADTDRDIFFKNEAVGSEVESYPDREEVDIIGRSARLW